MKKSSRDYRKSRRKKWVVINTRNANVALTTAMGVLSIVVINSQINLSTTEKSIRIAQQLIHTAQQIKDAFSDQRLGKEYTLTLEGVSKF